MACALWFYGNGVSFQVVSGQSSFSTCAWSGPGSFLVVPAPLRQDGFQCQGFWEVGGFLPPTGPSQIFLVSLQGSTMFLTRASYCETVHTSSYYPAWPRWAFSANGPLIFLCSRVMNRGLYLPLRFCKCQTSTWGVAGFLLKAA